MFPVSDDGKTVITKNPTAEELHRTWRFYVRTGEAGKVTYRTASSRADRKAFDGRYVQLEDYITTYKMLLNGANALYRGTEMAKKTGKGAIAGVADYYAMTKAAGKQGVNNAVDFSGVGIKAGTDAEGDYLQITYQTPLNRFYAMYSCNGSLYEPMPEDFINLVGIKNLAGYSTDKSTSPVDNILSMGPYMLETWETDKLITFHRNDQWYERQENPNLYRIEGIHTDILPGYATDKNIAIKQFLKPRCLWRHLGLSRKVFLRSSRRPSPWHRCLEIEHQFLHSGTLGRTLWRKRQNYPHDQRKLLERQALDVQ